MDGKKETIASEDEEEESDKILKQVLDEIGVDLSQQVNDLSRAFEMYVWY